MTQRRDVIGELRRVLHELGLERDRGVLLAVSGGRDSMALAKAFAMLNERSERPWLVHAAVVDHGLRAASVKEAAFAQSTLVKWGIGCETVRLQPPARLPNGSLAWAREQRYAALETIRMALRFGFVATAHHLDDQAETVLLRLVRGAAPQTLIGMRRVQGALLRPLLSLRRADIDRFVLKHGVPFVEDPSNADPAHPRSLVRAEVLPLLERVGGGGVCERLAALAGDLAEDEAALSSLVPVRKGVTLPLASFETLPPAIRRRVVWAWLQRFAVGLGRAHLEACLALTAGAEVRLPGGATVVRRGARLAVLPSTAKRERDRAKRRVRARTGE